MNFYPTVCWSQNTSKVIKALRNCDSLYTISKQDLRVCDYSDSVKSNLILSYSKNKTNDSLLIKNLNSQIEIKDKQILNYQQFKVKQKNNLFLYSGAGIIIGYLIRKELQSLINKI